MSKLFAFYHTIQKIPKSKNSDIDNEPKCQIGVPLRNVFCGRGPNRQNCPRGYSCNVHPGDRYAVCCRNRRKEFNILVSTFIV